MVVTDKPSRCIDPVMKYCQGCEWGHIVYPDWVETYEDLQGCCFDTFCTLGFDKGRLEDEPTEEELKNLKIGVIVLDKTSQNNQQVHSTLWLYPMMPELIMSSGIYCGCR